MPNNATAKTKWALSALVVGLAVAIVLLLSFFVPGSPRNSSNYQLLRTDATNLRVGSKTYSLEVVSTPARMQRGLGNRDTLPADRGMIFVFNSVNERCFWMKDMRFAIDMIWLDAHRTVAHVEPRVPPESYPKSFCYNAQYVVELAAGEAAKAGVHEGQTLNF